MKGLFIPDITAEMFKDASVESVAELMTEGKIYDIDYQEPCKGLECKECASEHRQLAEGLKELKQLSEQEPILGKIKAEIGMYEADCRLQGGTDECEKCNSNIFGSIYRIIDKYKLESEVR